MKEMSYSTVTMVGLGYIGLPTAAVMAGSGIKVIGLDVSSRIVDTVNRGSIHIVEPGLETLVREMVAAGRLSATLEPQTSDAFLVAVPTPFKGDHAPGLSYVEAAAKNIARILKKGDLVVLESTSPVGATEQMVGWLAAERPDLAFPRREGDKTDVNVAYCPERVLPGNVIEELKSNDRVIGGMTSACALRAQAGDVPGVVGTSGGGFRR